MFYGQYSNQLLCLQLYKEPGPHQPTNPNFKTSTLSSFLYKGSTLSTALLQKLSWVKLQICCYVEPFQNLPGRKRIYACDDIVL